MVTEGYERALRRLMEQHRKTDRCVATCADGVQVRIWTQWDDERGRLRVVEVRSRWRSGLDATRRVAEAALGKSWLSGFERWASDANGCTVWYALAIDGGAYHRPRRLSGRPATLRRW